MATKITWFGHACWQLETGAHTVLVDPYLDDSPTAAVKSADVNPSFILLTHGHFDHVGDTVKIAKRTGATVIANVEIVEWLTKHGVKNTQDMNTGGWWQAPFGRVKLTVAHHSSTLPDGTYAGNPNGFVVKLEGLTIYIAGDTALTYDMQLLKPIGIDLAILPIGDLYTMGPEDSLEAINFVDAKHAAPSHYNTWPAIKEDASQWADQVRAKTKAKPIVLLPGESITL